MKKTLSQAQKSLQLNKDFAWVERIAWLLDNKYQIKGLPFRFGLDPLLNFIPFLGKLLTFLTSLVLVLLMWRNGVSPKAVMLMLINILIDAIFGSIPLFGSVFDFFHKANAKNIKLLREYYFEGKHQGKGYGIIGIVLGILLLFCAVVLWLLWAAGTWLYGLIF